MIEDTLKLINDEFSAFDNSFRASITSSVPDFEEVLLYFLEQKSKKIRPVVGILLSKMLGYFNEKQSAFLQAVEFIHNATLFHDDIIDEADIRRGFPSLNKKFSNKIAVLSGDFFLTLAIKLISKLKNDKIYELLGEYMKLICEGEIEQNYSINKIISIDEYIEKSRKKTALLFKLTAEGVAILANANENTTSAFAEFAENFGIAFQINDDIRNFMSNDNKPVLNDLKSGVTTAPVIYLANENTTVSELILKSDFEKILELLKNSDAISKSVALMKFYQAKSCSSLKSFEDNEYKNALINLFS